MPSDYPYWRRTTWFEGAERFVHPFGWIGQIEGVNIDGHLLVGRGCPANYRHASLYNAETGNCPISERYAAD